MIVYLVSLVAATALGVGYVLQQRVAAHAAQAPPLSVSLLRQILHRRQWWVGLATMSLGQALGSWAMGMRSLALVEPLLTVSLLVAFAAAGVVARRWPTWQEVVGTAILAGALAAFLGLGAAAPATRSGWAPSAVAAGVAAVATVCAALVSVARRRDLAAEAVLLATAAGCMYGLQDVATRGSLESFHAAGIVAVLTSPWPYLVAAGAVSGLVLTQSAYRAGRLDYALPPTAATEPVIGICLGAGLLGDRLSTSPGALAIDALCGVALVGGVVVIGRSPALSTLGPAGGCGSTASAAARRTRVR